MRTLSLHHGDCLAVLRTLPENSVDAVVTDPPYGLSFMGKKWDYDVPSEEIWCECLRVLKPGGHLLAFAGTRTQHRMAVRIEDAGFEIRDMIAWVYGSGFPKSLDVSKAIDKNAGMDREDKCPRPQDAPVTDTAKQWSGWGTALKPALEPITVARKPLAGTVAENVLQHGTGALNIDGCRVTTSDNLNGGAYADNGSDRHDGTTAWRYKRDGGAGEFEQPTGRWPANLIHDGSDEVVELFPSSKAGTQIKPKGTGGMWTGKSNDPCGPQYGDSGSAARFFYSPKASKADRERGLENAPVVDAATMVDREPDSAGIKNARAGAGRTSGSKNPHPTVKPIALMRYLIRLVTPPNGVVLDPFMGSGTTGLAALDEQQSFIGIEREDIYFQIAQRRLNGSDVDGFPNLDAQ